MATFLMSIWRIIMENRRTRKPTHPGELIREDLMPETGISQTDLARLIGVSRRTVSEIIHERRRLTPDIAFRLAKVFNSTPEMWLNMQQAVDLWEANKNHGQEYEKIRPLQEAASP
jgi:addiction module HigA family antidote